MSKRYYYQSSQSQTTSEIIQFLVSQGGRWYTTDKEEEKDKGNKRDVDYFYYYIDPITNNICSVWSINTILNAFPAIEWEKGFINDAPQEEVNPSPFLKSIVMNGNGQLEVTMLDENNKEKVETVILPISYDEVKYTTIKQHGKDYLLEKHIKENNIIVNPWIDYDKLPVGTYLFYKVKDKILEVAENISSPLIFQDYYPNSSLMDFKITDTFEDNKTLNFSEYTSTYVVLAYEEDIDSVIQYLCKKYGVCGKDLPKRTGVYYFNPYNHDIDYCDTVDRMKELLPNVAFYEEMIKSKHTVNCEIYYRGDPKYGQVIIDILIEKGGINNDNLSGCDSDSLYYIVPDTNEIAQVNEIADRNEYKFVTKYYKELHLDEMDIELVGEYIYAYGGYCSPIYPTYNAAKQKALELELHNKGAEVKIYKLTECE